MKDLLNKYVGKRFYMPLEGLTVAVEALDVKEAWGSTLIYVQPLMGAGKIWVKESRLKEEINTIR